MKKLLALVLALGFLSALAACGNPGTQTAQSETTTLADTVVPAETGAQPPMQAMLYLPNDNADGFVTKQVQTDGTIEDLIAQLAAEGALPAGCAPLSFQAGEQGALDMNEAFGRAVTTTGTTGEYLLFGSLVNTVLTYFELGSVSVTSEGQTIESGHATYDEPLRFFENQVAVTE